MKCIKQLYPKELFLSIGLLLAGHRGLSRTPALEELTIQWEWQSRDRPLARNVWEAAVEAQSRCSGKVWTCQALPSWKLTCSLVQARVKEHVKFQLRFESWVGVSQARMCGWGGDTFQWIGFVCAGSLSFFLKPQLHELDLWISPAQGLILFQS